MIEVKNLTKRYGNHVAVDNLSFKVEKGQIYGFLGPNGAGKSTTMNIITGYLATNEGEVLINGHDILKEPEEAKKCIGYLPEMPPLYQDMTVNEYLRFVAELKGVAKEERDSEVEKAKSILRIEEMSNRLIKNLSKGYKQRVGFAQALIGLPEILILDEPTVGLDPKQIIEMRDLIKNLGEKHTIILSSHILSEVRAVCDHIMIIAKGKLIASDTPDNLLKSMQPITMFKLTVRTDRETVGSILSTISDIKETQISSSSEAGAVDVVIKYPTEVDLREQIFDALTKENITILQMNLESASLEDVFLELTSEDNIEMSDTDNDTDSDNSEFADDGDSDSETGSDTESDSEYNGYDGSEEEASSDDNADDNKDADLTGNTDEEDNEESADNLGTEDNNERNI